MEEPNIKVGICDRYREIHGRLDGRYRIKQHLMSGEFSVRSAGGIAVLMDAFGREIARAPQIRMTAEPNATFTLQDVTIGVQFHWERREAQTFSGDLLFIASDEREVTAVNELPVEAYLVSVVSSEMNGEAPFEFLKAHAIASRSWLVAMLQRERRKPDASRTAEHVSRRNGELTRWYDREDHDRFDVCADDHCQRYQGITGRISGRAAEAVRSTRGVFLIFDGEICDARYHKACGGMTEDYATCWEERAIPYLSHVSDSAMPHAPIRSERDAERWFLSAPDVYCNTRDRHLLGKILPAFDLETSDFFRWRISYSREELESILNARSGIDFGRLQSIRPVDRGPSGRIRRLQINGSEAAIIVGKELEIRRWLSSSHLYSSAFFVFTERSSAGIPSRFTFHGAGWGHGVGLCQIGAAVMAEKGFCAEEILRHYFRGAALVKRY